MPARDRRTVSELPAESDAVSRETLLEVLTSQGPATARTWGQVVQSAARLWAVPLPISLAPTAGPGLLVRLRVVGEGIARNTSAGDWPALIVNGQFVVPAGGRVKVPSLRVLFNGC